MAIIPKILLWLALLSLAACKPSNKKSESVWTDLPEVTSLDSLTRTDFVLTLESQIPANENVVYAPAFLFAWDKVKVELKSQIIFSSQNSDAFKQINNSASHQGSLTSDEYTVNTEMVDGAIVVKSFFNKTLPFETELQALEQAIQFGETKVKAFGMHYFNQDAVKLTKILYYKNDDNFVLKLVPKDKQHEIILAKGLGDYNTLKDGINRTNALIDQGKKEQTDNTLLWMYQILPEDYFAIPSVKFNIETNYRELEGQRFSTVDKKQHSFEVAYQRIGFILNEKGAVVVSEDTTAVDSAGTEPIIIHPKKMIFDQAFLIIIKRVDNPNPYFVLKVTNAELLERSDPDASKAD